MQNDIKAKLNKKNKLFYFLLLLYTEYSLGICITTLFLKFIVPYCLMTHHYKILNLKMLWKMGVKKRQTVSRMFKIELPHKKVFKSNELFNIPNQVVSAIRCWMDARNKENLRFLQIRKRLKDKDDNIHK